jgi:hypothetical protein
MGYCIEGEGFYDAFLSYARDDDDAHNGWVQGFESYLRQMVEAELRRTPDVDKEDARHFRVCRDETGFPQHGDLDGVIDEKVQHSAFLFVFLGKAYLKSKYCLQELDIFRRETGGSIEEALKRTYVIVLDREAVELLREGVPEQLLPQRNRLWSMLRDVSQKAIRKENFLRNEGLLPVYASQFQRFDDTFHEQCHPLVQEFTKNLIMRRRLLHPPQRQPEYCPGGAARPGKGRILMGVVPPRLVRARDELIHELGLDSVEVLDVGKLCQEPEKLCQQFAGARLLIQPFDAFKPLLNLKRPDPPGGHLGLQKQLFDACQANCPSAPSMEMLWWEPVPTNTQESEVPPATGSSDDNAPIEPYDAQFLDQIPFAQRRRCTARDLAAELRASQFRPSVAGKVWVEWEETDEKKIQRAQALVRTYFEKVCSARSTERHIHCPTDIEFGDADWRRLEKKLAERPDGVVIVINENKDDEAVDRQIEVIESREDFAVKKMFPGIFYLRPKDNYRPPSWSTVRFRMKYDGIQYDEIQYDEDEITRFAVHLFNVLNHKYS